MDIYFGGCDMTIHDKKREHTTTITVSIDTAIEVRKVAGQVQLKTGERVRLRDVVDLAIELYKKEMEMV